MPIFGSYILVVFLNVAMIMDMLTGKIKNQWILVGLMGGFFLQISTRGLEGVQAYSVGVLCMGALTIGGFLLHILGAGDVKLFLVIGGILGAKDGVTCLWYSLVVGAILAFVKLMKTKTIKTRMLVLIRYVQDCVQQNKILSYPADFQDEKAVMHFSIPIVASILIWIGGIR